MGNRTRRVAALTFGLGLGLVGCDSKPTETAPKATTEKVTPKQNAPQAKEVVPEAPAEDSLRFIVTSEDEPLASEKAQLEELKGALGKAKLRYDASPASDEEKKAARDLAEGRPAEVSSWARYRTVVVLEIVKPEGTEKGKRISRGRGNLFILHPPEKVPALSTVYETKNKGAWLEGGKFGVWLSTHLRYRKGNVDSTAKPEKHEPVSAKKEEE